mmetsp:Transcript_57340/g.104802  ORF Transcript_57340/g.104802 Transcript_57340/m.104802 type:complete len:205 (+) Transcript_57340:762-1376(+)
MARVATESTTTPRLRGKKSEIRAADCVARYRTIIRPTAKGSARTSATIAQATNRSKPDTAQRGPTSLNKGRASFGPRHTERISRFVDDRDLRTVRQPLTRCLASTSEKCGDIDCASEISATASATNGATPAAGETSEPLGRSAAASDGACNESAGSATYCLPTKGDASQCWRPSRLKAARNPHVVSLARPGEASRTRKHWSTKI